MKRGKGWAYAGLLATVLMAGCSTPVEFSLTGADAGNLTHADDADFSSMDKSVAQCKAAAASAGHGKCVQIRAYEACMKTHGYLTVLGPENPPNCGQPAWEQDARKWLQ